MRLLLIVTLCFASLNAWSIDSNFRFKTGFCHKNRIPGLNPGHFGECGNLTSKRIINKIHNSVNLKGANLSSSYIYVTHFKGGDLSHLSLRRSVLLQSSFNELKAESMDIRGSHIKGVTFNKVNLKNLLATGARFVKTSFKNCDLQNAEFWGGNLQEVIFSGSDLRGANLESTSAMFTDFRGAKFNSKTKLPFNEAEALKKGMVKID